MLPSVDKLMNYEALKVDPAILSPAELMFNKNTKNMLRGSLSHVHCTVTTLTIFTFISLRVSFSLFNENFLIYTYLLFGVHNYNLEIFTHWLTLRILGHITFLCTQFTVFLDILLLGVHY